MSYRATPLITGGNAIAITPANVITNAIQPLQISANIATVSSLGVVKIGANLTIAADGTLSANVGSGGGGSGNITVGTWTPILDTTGIGVYVIAIRYATYSKIGQQVNCYFDFTVTSITGGTNPDTLFITGLPFTSNTSLLGNVGSLYTSYITGVSVGGYAGTITGTVPAASTQVNLWDTNNVSTGLKQESVKALSQLIGTITYLSAT
jgi:hypothetical protein